MEKYSRIKALISLDAIRYNFEQMKKNIKEGTKIIAVIKADAYGHGAVPIARMLEEFDYIWGFAAATAQEALQLRKAGVAGNHFLRHSCAAGRRDRFPRRGLWTAAQGVESAVCGGAFRTGVRSVPWKSGSGGLCDRNRLPAGAGV